MSGTVLQILLPILVAVSTGVAGLIGVYFKAATTKVNQQTSQIANEDDKAIAYKVLSDVEDAIKTATVATNQTFVDALKAKSSDGKLSTIEMQEAFKKTFDTTISLLGVGLLDEARKLKPDITAWINTKIEYYVNSSK